jgi:hypothetical protein
MTPADKWNAFSARADLPVALVVVLAGVALVAAQKKLAVSRQARVSRGELSDEEARKNATLVRRCSYCIITCDAFLVIMWVLGR